MVLNILAAPKPLSHAQTLRTTFSPAPTIFYVAHPSKPTKPRRITKGLWFWQPGHISYFCGLQHSQHNVENGLRPEPSKCQLNHQKSRSTPEPWCSKWPVAAEDVEIINKIIFHLLFTTFAFPSSFPSMVGAECSSSSSLLAWASPARCPPCFIHWCYW